MPPDAVPVTAGPLWGDLHPGTLSTAIVGRRIRVYDLVESTNTLALDHGRHGDVYVADRQSAGRGRLGRTWHSAPGKGLWLSVAFETPMEGLVFAAALAVRDAVPSDIAPSLKWPNDVLANGKKLSGILIEQQGDRVALGIGINVNHESEDFPVDLRQKATSLRLETRRVWPRREVFQSLLIGLDERVILLQQGGFEALHAEWAAACAVAGREIQCGPTRGVVQRIDTDGALQVDTGHERVRITAGDVVYLD